MKHAHKNLLIAEPGLGRLRTADSRAERDQGHAARNAQGFGQGHRESWSEQQDK